MFVLAPAVDAAQITSRSTTLGVSTPGAATTYAFSFTVPTTGTAIKSFSAQACTTPLGSCTTPTGFSITGSTLTAQPTGFGAASGWTVNTATAGQLRMVDASNATTPSGSQAVSFSGVTNSTTVNTAYYLRITTYSDSAWTTAIDTGNTAVATDDATTDLPVSAVVAEALTFCVGTSGATCGTIAGTSVSLNSGNPLSTASIGTGTSEMIASTNAGSGLVITYNAGQFTNGTHNFANGFTSSGAASSPGTEEFGLNATESGSGGVVSSPYNTANYAWNPAVTTSIGTSGGAPLTLGTWTVNYGANVSATTPYGSYSTKMVFTCTPTF
jgi:hypothetical protein